MAKSEPTLPLGLDPVDEPKDVQLIRHQDRFITPFMTKTEADSLIDGYPGEYSVYKDWLAAREAEYAKARSNKKKEA